jgi:Flp pilus assembly CpaF family ATPase
MASCETTHHILISGGTGTTTLLNAIAAFIPDDDRLVFIEDTAEIQIDKPEKASKSTSAWTLSNPRRRAERKRTSPPSATSISP